MKILFLGGTGFVGRHIAEAVIAAGHNVTFFNRGTSNAALFPEQRHVRGDRAGDVSILATIEADVVIDTCGYTPDAVSASARAVAGRVAKYVFMSSINAYDLSIASIDESSPAIPWPPDATRSELRPELYGAQKAQCERELAEIMGSDRVVCIRAGLMVGPYDKTDRFTYWPVRVARGGEIAVPVGRDMPVQIIDVRDVAEWTLGALSRDLHGTFNLVGTPGSLDFGAVLDACAAVAQNAPDFTWLTTEFLEAHEVGPWVELPLWLPFSEAEAGVLNISNDRACATGLRLRPLRETVQAIVDEYRLRPRDYTLRAGLTPEREAALLRAWHAGASGVAAGAPRVFP